MTPNDQPMMVALMAAQFTVHAVGWGMTARLFRNWRGPQGQFALSWAALALGLFLYVPALHSGHPFRNLADLLVVAALVWQHRGLVLHWGERPPDRFYKLLLAAVVLLEMLSHAISRGHALRVSLISA